MKQHAQLSWIAAQPTGPAGPDPGGNSSCDFEGAPLTANLREEGLHVLRPSKGALPAGLHYQQ